MLWQQIAVIWALPFLEWIGIAMGGPIYSSRVQIITLEQFIPGCVIFDEVLKLNSSDNAQTHPWNLLGRLEVFLQNASQIVLFLHVDLTALDKCCTCYHVATVTHDTASIIQESVLSREVAPPPLTSAGLFSLFPLPSFPSLPPSLPFVLPPSVPHATVCLHFWLMSSLNILVLLCQRG